MKPVPRSAIQMEKQLGWGGKLGEAESLGISKADHSVSQVDGVSDMAPAYQLCGGGGRLENGQWPLLALMPDPLVSFCIPLVPFKLPPWYWSSEGVSLSS